MKEKERGGSERGFCCFLSVWTSLSCSSSNEEDKQRTLTTCYSVAMAIKCKSILTFLFLGLTLCDKIFDFVYTRVPWFCSSIFVVRGCSPHEITSIIELIHLRRFCLRTKKARKATHYKNTRVRYIVERI